jgi:hypothetical protein
LGAFWYLEHSEIVPGATGRRGGRFHMNPGSPVLVGMAVLTDKKLTGVTVFGNTPDIV